MVDFTSKNKKMLPKLLLTAFLLSFLLLSFQVIDVCGDSMHPTLDDGDRMLIWRLPYRIGQNKLDYGDIMVFVAPEHVPCDLLIKRVIGLENDTIEISNGMVYRNQVPLVEDYALGDTNPAQMLENLECSVDSAADSIQTVPQNHVYVLGDNRCVSYDSRTFGPLPVDSITGLMVLPLR